MHMDKYSLVHTHPKTVEIPCDLSSGKLIWFSSFNCMSLEVIAGRAKGLVLFSSRSISGITNTQSAVFHVLMGKLRLSKRIRTAAISFRLASGIKSEIMLHSWHFGEGGVGSGDRNSMLNMFMTSGRLTKSVLPNDIFDRSLKMTKMEHILLPLSPVVQLTCPSSLASLNSQSLKIYKFNS